MAQEPSYSALPRRLPDFLMGEDKRTQILRAALLLFLRDGYAETSMDAITAAAGVSKATVYAHFKNKESLFKEIIREGSGQAFEEFPPLQRGQGPIAQDLLRFFGPVQQLIWESDGHHWHRLVIAEGGRHPDLAQTFFECVIARMTGKIQGYIDSLKAMDLIDPIDSKLAADAILSLAIIRPIHSILLLGDLAKPIPEVLEWNIRLFLKGIGAKA